MSTTSPEPRSKSGLPKPVWRLGWISFFGDIASEMAYPVMPLFVTRVLQIPEGLIGLIEGLAEATVSLVKGWSGWHSDKRGVRTPYIKWGYFLTSIGKPLLGFATSWHIVLASRMTDRFGKGIRTTARDAYLADSVSPANYGQAFGFHRAMDTAGAFLGVGLAIVLLRLFPENLRLIFYLSAIPALISVLIALNLKEQQPRAIPERTPIHLAEIRKDIKLFPREYWKSLAVTLIFKFANSSDAFLVLMSKAMGLSDFHVVVAYALYNLTYALSSYPFGILSDRIGRWKLIFVGWIVFALVYFGFALLSGNWAWLLWAIYGLHIGMTQGVGKALIADHTPTELKGTGMGFFELSAGFVVLAGNLFTGYLWQNVSRHAAMTASASIALLATLLGIVWIRKKRSPLQPANPSR